MIARITWRRWLSRCFTAAAAALLPRLESPWGDAMKAEIEAIESDRDALHWAWGCLRTACVRRMGAGLRDHRSARSLVGTYLLLLSIAPLGVVAYGVIYHSGSRRAFEYVSQHQMATLVFGSVPFVILVFVMGALSLASALAVMNRRLRTAAELMLVWFAMNWICSLALPLFYPAMSALLQPTHMSYSAAIRGVLNVCVVLWLWCGRSVERESLGAAAQ